MKRLFTLCAAVLFGMAAFAQEQKAFSHLAIGINAGTTGVGLDLATPLSDNFQARVGFGVLPLKVTTDLDISSAYPSNLPPVGSLPSKLSVDGKLDMFNAKVLVDFFPMKSSSFHVTAGLFIGSSKVVKVNNSQPGALSLVNEANDNIRTWNAAHPDNTYNEIGLSLGDYVLTPDKQGNADGYFKVGAVKPYVGLGFGRACPKNKTVGFMFELGAMFWGSPKAYCNDVELNSSNVDGDAGEILKTVSKLSVYPVMNFRLCFKAM